MKNTVLLLILLPLAAYNQAFAGGWTERERAIIMNQPEVMRVLTVKDASDAAVLRSISKDLDADAIANPLFGVLAAKMLATVTSPGQDGVGIAGPQVGILRRVVAVQRFDKEGEPFEVYPNICITSMRGEPVPGAEGCLSVPDRRGEVLRYQDIDISYVSPVTFQEVTERVQGFTAVIFQHECDHLDGTLYIDKLYQDPRMQDAFKEDFSYGSSNFFEYNYRRSGYDSRYYSGIPSFTEEGTDIMLYRIDPEDPAGAGRGPEIVSRNYTFYGSYSARFKLPKAKEVQPNVGAVAGYFTYNVDKELGLSEIDIEFLLADPRIIYVGTWTGKQGTLNRVGRTINLATGEILETIWRGETRNPDGTVTRIRNTPLTGPQSRPDKIDAIEDFDASSRFYTYGWDWYPDRLVWWMLHPETGRKVILWDYEGKVLFPGQPCPTGIPTHKSKYRFNFWHTNNWPVETNRASVEKPLYPYELEIDWMSYTPFRLSE